MRLVTRFRKAFFGLLAFSIAFAANAQSNSGTLTGQVREADSGRSLQGAIVSVPGTSLKDYTDALGRFTISEVPAGTQQVKVDYVGLVSYTEQVAIPSGAAKEIDVYLESRVVELESVTVRGFMSGQARAINQQKTAAGIVNVVSEENFGAVLDGNIGQALQRLPGISVDESQDGSQGSINIRGIAGEFNSVQMDGNRVPSSGGSNSYNPRQMAADGVTNIEVIKAPTPDQDGDAIGGIINLVTRSAFERDGQKMKLKVAGVLNEEPDNWGHAATFSYSDLLSMGGGEKNLGIAFTVSSYETDRYSRNADQDWVQVTPETNPELGLDAYDTPVWFMESTHFEHDTRTTTTQTLSGSIDFRTDERNSFYFRPMISQYERSGVKYETDIDIDTEFDNDADGSKTYAALTPTYGRGSEDSEASRGWIGTLDDQDNDLYSVSMGGRHELESNLLTYDVYFSRNKAKINDDSELNMLMEPEDPWFIFEYDIVDARGDIAVNVVNGVDSTDLSQMTEGELEDIWGVKEEKVHSARIDWERKFAGESGSFTFKTGAKYRKSSQFRDMTVDLYEMDEDFPYADVIVPTDEVIFLKEKYYNVQPQIGLDMLNTNPELFEFVEDDSLEDSNVEDYDAEETVSAAYVMGTYETGIHTIIAGVRFEENKWDNTNKIVSYLDDVATVTPVQSGNSHSFWLPGIHFRHALSENLILRESYNKSYARPRLSELSRGRWVDDDGNIEDGNPNLIPAESDNLDAQIEYYTERGGLYSIGVFYKDIKNFTYTQVYDFDELDENGIPIPADGGDLEYERPVNGAGATNYGIELIARQQLYFLPGALRGFGVALSTTFTESDAEYPNRTDGRELPLEGFSELLYTATLDYNLGNLSARIDYRFRDDYIEGLGDDIESDEFYAAEERVDAEVSYQVNEGVRLFATATNLTDRPQISYQGYAQFVEDASFAGRKFTFGAEFEF
ncbi:TonB-dependent receptor [Pelagicoccus sp. SDUM812003]|uniref:TonB-dependent receptor n=1 Tax=Pelagicoccus sp. SDUM812003 TaxID=3041267 RepID=UPI00280FCB46|nr:TonB-dependent receptor [Pelagicoccus sp. SDUM812003]MDQ8204136.1 TonB-dependent receptor [Pelagicoccus sp. SDUM812003]